MLVFLMLLMYQSDRPLIRNGIGGFFVHVAQMEEQPALNRQVPGSRPGMRSTHRTTRRGNRLQICLWLVRFQHGALCSCSQVVWQPAFNRYIAGSNPVTCILVP